MAKQIALGDIAVDNFPIFNSDGYTKKSGEIAFTETLRKESIAQSVPVTISEIGSTGEYKVSFLPNSVGFWSLEVLIDYNKQIWYGEFQVGSVGEEVIWGATMADNGSTAVFGIWLEQAGVRRTDIVSINAVLKNTLGAIIVDLGSGVATPEGVFKFSTPSSNLQVQVPYYLSCTATDGVQTWNNNLGVAKSG